MMVRSDSIHKWNCGRCSSIVESDHLDGYDFSEKGGCTIEKALLKSICMLIAVLVVTLSIVRSAAKLICVIVPSPP